MENLSTPAQHTPVTRTEQVLVHPMANAVFEVEPLQDKSRRGKLVKAAQQLQTAMLPGTLNIPEDQLTAALGNFTNKVYNAHLTVRPHIYTYHVNNIAPGCECIPGTHFMLSTALR